MKPELSLKTRIQQRATWNNPDLLERKLKGHIESQHNGIVDPKCRACQELSGKGKS